jgi:hypothetical protein
MNKTWIAWIFGATIIAASAPGQGFVNLDFESAQLIPVSTNGNGSINIATANALPGWTAFSGTNQLSLIPYNTPDYVASPPVGLLLGATTIGNFAVLLEPGSSISQTGSVPANAISLLFAVLSPGSSPFTVSLDGQELSYAAIGNAVNSHGFPYTIFGVDISAFAGQVATLTFSSRGGILDNIQFSPQAVPEPAESALLAFGALAFSFHRWRKSRPRRAQS